MSQASSALSVAADISAITLLGAMVVGLMRGMVVTRRHHDEVVGLLRDEVAALVRRVALLEERVGRAGSHEGGKP